MNKRKAIWTAVLIGTVLVLCVAGTKISRLTRTTSFNSGSLFLVVTGSQETGWQTRAIEDTNLFATLTNLPLPFGPRTIKTNGVNLTTAATSIDFVTGSNTVVQATNTSGAVTVQINASASGGGASSNYTTVASGSSTLGSLVVTNASEMFGTVTHYGNTVLAGVQVDGDDVQILSGGNLIIENPGGFSNTGSTLLGGALDPSSTNLIHLLSLVTPAGNDRILFEDVSGAVVARTFFTNILDALGTGTGVIPYRTSAGWGTSADNFTIDPATFKLSIGATDSGSLEVYGPAVVGNVEPLSAAINSIGATNAFGVIRGTLLKPSLATADRISVITPGGAVSNGTFKLDLSSPSAGEVLQFHSSTVVTNKAVSGAGDVTAASSFGTDNRLVRSDGAGKGVQASGITLSDADEISGAAAITSAIITHTGTMRGTGLYTNTAGIVVDGSNFAAYDGTDYMVFGAVTGGMDTTLDAWGFNWRGNSVATWSTNTSTINSNLSVLGTNLAGQLRITGLATGSIPYIAESGIIRTAALSGLTLSGGILTATGSGGGASTNATQFGAAGATLTLKSGIQLTNVDASGFTNRGLTEMVGSQTNRGALGIAGAVTHTGTMRGHGTYTNLSGIAIEGANLATYDSPDYFILGAQNGGIDTTLDSWAFSMSGNPVATWSTNNSIINSNLNVGGSSRTRGLWVTNALNVLWFAKTSAATIDAATGVNQYATLGASTNLTFVPAAGADGSNSVPIVVSFTQDATGGKTITLNGIAVGVDTNALATTDLTVWLQNGVTNIDWSIPFRTSVAAKGDMIAFDGTNWLNIRPGANGLVPHSTNTGTGFYFAAPAGGSGTTVTNDGLTNSTVIGLVNGAGVAIKTVKAGSNVTIDNNGTNLVINASSATLNGELDTAYITNKFTLEEKFVTQDTSGLIIVDFNRGNNFYAVVMTNVTALVYTNCRSGIFPAQIRLRQDTNGGWSLARLTNTLGLVLTNSTITLTTNANALDRFELTSDFGTNVMMIDIGAGSASSSSFVSLSTSNAVSKPLSNSYTGGTLTTYGLQAGFNGEVTMNATNIVVGAATNLTIKSALIDAATNNTLRVQGAATFIDAITHDVAFSASFGLTTLEQATITTTASGPRFNAGQMDARTNLNAGSITLTNSFTMVGRQLASIVAFRTNQLDFAQNNWVTFTNALATNTVFQITNAATGVPLNLTVYGSGIQGGAITNAWQVLFTMGAGSTVFWPAGVTNGNYDVLVNSNQVVQVALFAPRTTNVLASFRAYE